MSNWKTEFILYSPLFKPERRIKTRTLAFELAPWFVLSAAFASLYHLVEAMKVVQQLGNMGQCPGLFVHRPTKGSPLTCAFVSL